jgi:polyhydroxybutyrate depolymerase
MLRRLLFAAGAILALPLVLLIAFVAVVALGTPKAPPAPSLAGRIETNELDHEGRTRRWLLYVPSQPASPAPLVVVLPGSGQSAEAMRQVSRYRFEELAERDGTLVAYAEGWEHGGAFGLSPEWNECRKSTDLPAHRENVDDVGFVLRVVDEIAREHTLDPDRLYATGLSDGGDMSFRLATEFPDRFAAIAAVIAQQAAPESSNCLAPRGPISVLVMNGTDDPIIPFDGGEASFHGVLSAGEVQSMHGTLEHWRRVDGLAGEPITERLPDVDSADGSRVERDTWRAGEREVVGYRVIGGGHTFPGGWQYAPEWLVGGTNRDLHGADEIWGFFQRHRRTFPAARAPE